MENKELMVKIPLYDYKVLCELRGQVDALERMCQEKKYIDLDEVVEIFGFEKKEMTERLSDDDAL